MEGAKPVRILRNGEPASAEPHGSGWRLPLAPGKNEFTMEYR